MEIAIYRGVQGLLTAVNGWFQPCLGLPHDFHTNFHLLQKSKPPEIQREKYGTICYFGHRCFQLREDIKMFQETQPLKYSNRFPTIIDSPIIWAPPSAQNPFVTLHASDPSPWAPFQTAEFSYSLCWCLTTACLTHRSKHKIMVDNIIL